MEQCFWLAVSLIIILLVILWCTSVDIKRQGESANSLDAVEKI